ncbi:hypothetical protein D6372_23900, partial [Salmonella enterica subsp. enterica serovar Typhimurium]|nr:hypothetical protein [Salmonella enterica subsp. enterica serovar Typhimurium]
AKPSHPARPTNVKKRPKGAFLLSAIWKIRTCRRFGSCLMRCAYQAYRRYRSRRPDKTLRRHQIRGYVIIVTFLIESAILFSI